MAPAAPRGDAARAMAERRPAGNGRPSGRGRPDDPLMQEVRWRLFRREDLPARLRRLQRLEDAALSERGNRPPDDREGGDAGG
jgi:hypothetical protein